MVAMSVRQEVSVVIPVRDDADLLRRCLEALERQSVPPAEVIVVDNASSDSSAAVAAEFGHRVVTEPLHGIWPAAATGYDLATSPIIARLDADSVPGPAWVEQVSEALSTRPQADAVTGWGVFRDLPWVLGAAAAVAYLGSYYLLGYAALARMPLWGSNMAVRREAWHAVRENVHRTEREVHDDMDLALALGPHRVVTAAPRLVVGVSARSLRGSAQMARRFRRAFRTLSLNWAGMPPWQRWARRFQRPGHHPPRLGSHGG